ncbi:MAG TPA: complex I NDUFA9 subunit family protein [Tepidisphaeraceae bacterium]|jgi:NADH dehydrogenase
MAGRIFVTGASGFVGTAVVEELLSRGYDVSALSNRRKLSVQDPRLRTTQGDLFNPRALDEGLRDCDAVIHLVGIIMEKPSAGVTFSRIHFEGTQQIVDATKRAGIRRYVHMSALGTRPSAVSDYHKTKWRAEEYVRQSGLDWTVIRPSMIHGPRGEFIQMEAQWARHRAPAPIFFMPFMPYFGGKRAGRLQPVYVGDVARAFVDAVEKPATIGEIYLLGGPEVVTWPQLHQTISKAVVGKKRMVASMPIPIARTLARIGVGKLLGFNRDQVIMSQEDNTCDIRKFTSDFGWQPRPFAASVNEYAPQI